MKKNPILRTLAFAMILIVLLTGCATRTQAVQETVITEVTSSVKEIQKYGNLVLTIEKKDLDAMGAEYGDVFTVSFQDTEVYAPYCTNYSDVDLGSIVLRNDGETLILAINMGDFATTYSIAEKVSNPDKTYKWIFEEGNTMEDISLLLTLTGKGEYRDEWLIHQLSRTDNREDYSSDAAFANFREIKGGKIGEGALFRSSSPINNEIGRAKYADALVKENGIRTVMNLADSEESILSYMEKEDFASPYYASLFENGDVIALNMGVSFKTREFQASLSEGLTFLASKEGPYLVHCTEGKDRAGFTSALLSALMGLTYQEIVEDYMTTYENYYHIEKGSEQYEAVKKSNIDSMLSFIASVESDKLSQVDLSLKAEEFLFAIGMEEETVRKLKENLAKNYR
ncbi:MAG: tyrosine-protein phosphatase [Candidatus Ornithospirochaeta sp.]|nr:tyrosine-protein phosphatase [Sphaerochaetaceae bacterium]MDY5522914.1 tyrosine-protein phosphatase [Candidatus Ornithospirochaeta sp.]